MSRQLTLPQRAVLAELLGQNAPRSKIAERLDVHRSTIYRELARNSGPRGYLYDEAQQRADTRRWQHRRPRKLEQPELQGFVCQGLQ
jgi:IS30 family transposase